MCLFRICQRQNLSLHIPYTRFFIALDYFIIFSFSDTPLCMYLFIFGDWAQITTLDHALEFTN
jgi:hypothetical protein